MKARNSQYRRFKALQRRQLPGKKYNKTFGIVVFVLIVIYLLVAYRKDNNDSFVDTNHIESKLYQLEHDKKVSERLNLLKEKKNRGKSLSPPEEFDLQYLAFTNTKSRVDGYFTSDHCSFSSPKNPKQWSSKKEKQLIEELGIHSGYLTSKSAKVLSLDHQICTNKAPEVYEESSLIFENVCITFNIDSLKMSQRGIIIFDDTNMNPERCVPCPNPQMTKEWGDTECGIMWVHQINSHPHLGDYQTCYNENRKKIKAHGQRQEPGENTQVKGGIYYTGTTLLLNFVQINPGHQLWDFLLSLVKPLRKGLQYDHSIAHSSDNCDDSLWVCHILRKLDFFKSPKRNTRGELDEENLLKLYPNVLTCFERIIIPVPGWDHSNDMLDSEELQHFREELLKAFDLPIRFEKIKTERQSMLVYPHNTAGEAGVRRAWLDIDITMTDLEPNVEVTKVDDFAALSVQDQIELFNSNNILIMSHGGQMANAIFCREGTVVVEVTCGGYSQLGSNNGYFTEALKLIHIIYTPCLCESGHKDSSNYNLPASEVIGLLSYLQEPNIGIGTKRLRRISCIEP